MSNDILFNVDGVSRCAAQPIKTGTQLIFPVLRIGDFFCVFVRYQIVINCVFSYFNWVITQIRSLIKVLVQTSFESDRVRSPDDIIKHIVLHMFVTLYLIGIVTVALLEPFQCKHMST